LLQRMHVGGDGLGTFGCRVETLFQLSKVTAGCLGIGALEKSPKIMGCRCLRHQGGHFRG